MIIVPITSTHEYSNSNTVRETNNINSKIRSNAPTRQSTHRDKEKSVKMKPLPLTKVMMMLLLIIIWALWPSVKLKTVMMVLGVEPGTARKRDPGS
jgi:hypothetical protein